MKLIGSILACASVRIAKRHKKIIYAISACLLPDMHHIVANTLSPIYRLKPFLRASRNLSGLLIYLRSPLASWPVTPLIRNSRMGTSISKKHMLIYRAESFKAKAKPIKSVLLATFRSQICQFVIWMHHLLKLIHLQVSLRNKSSI